MKKFLLTIFTIFICTVTFAQTINWYIGDTVYQTTTCESASSITPPIPPVKPGYTFVGWEGLYKQVEYLESTGTQYIDTGFVPTNKTSMQTKYHFLSLPPSGSSYQVGAGTNNDRYRFRFLIGNNGSVQTVIGTNLQTIVFNNTVHDIILDAKTYSATVDGVTVMQQNKSFIGSDRSFYIFNLNNNMNNVHIHDARCYYLKLYDNDVLVRDFIPVLDRNNVPCMFDKVEHKFYYNAGTGQFIAGPVIGE